MEIDVLFTSPQARSLVTRLSYYGSYFMQLKFILEQAMNTHKALHVGGWLQPCLSHSTPGKRSGTHYPGRLQGRCGRVWKVLVPPEFEPRIVQSLACRYSD